MLRLYIYRYVTAKKRAQRRNGRIMEGEDQEKTKDEDCGQRADEVSIAKLLKAKPFKMIHVDGIIQNVSRNHQHDSS